MLSKLRIEGLKSIDKMDIKLSSMNLFTGINSVGKSTIIQSILLVIQNIGNKNISPLNGHLISLGEFREVRNFNTKAEIIEVYIEDNEDNEIQLSVVEKEENGMDTCNGMFSKENLHLENLLNYENGKVSYIASSRIGYQDIYNKNIEKLDKFGLQGEYSMYYYNNHKSDVLEDCLIKGRDSSTLEGQINYWFKYILDANLKTEDIEGTDKVKARYISENGRAIRPKNMGSGLSYIISILIVCLSSQRGDIIIIENPEIHLHPKAQSKLCGFLCFIAKAERQLLIETHSDHIFNGIRVALVQKQLKEEQVKVNFLTLDDRKCTINTEVKFGSNGRILNHSDGLFDQFEDDLDKMLGI